MFTINTTSEEVFNEVPIVNEWIKIIETQFKKEINKSKLEFYFSYGFFHPKVENKDEYYIQMFENCQNMKFNERLEFELSKVRVNLTLQHGQFMLSDRLPKNIIPTSVREIVTEITKVKMFVEFEYHGNVDILNTIPEINPDVVSFELIKDVVKKDMSTTDYDLDSILDKISNQGMDSLSEEEKDFLDKKSKDM